MSLHHNPAQLWIGSRDHLSDKVTQHLQTIFCSNNGCQRCASCLQIQERTHHGSLWFSPDNGYTLEMLKPFFAHIARSLDPDQNFYFIFEHADYLSIACTNSLLKSIEEPPPGYHMIFLAQNLHAVAPTLRSRCTILHHHTDDFHEPVNPLVSFFTTGKAVLFEQFLQTVDSAALDERSTKNALEQILNFWINEYKKDPSRAHSIDKMEIIKESFEKLPMQGSAKIFWKNLFLRMI